MNDNHDDKGQFASAGGGAKAAPAAAKAGVDSHHASVPGPSYNPASVNRAISNASRYQGRVSKGEARAIHSLLKGRH